MLKQKITPNEENLFGAKLYSRFLIGALIIVFVSACISVKLFSTTVVKKEKWDAKANEFLSKRDTIFPNRGEILAADGSVLATDINFYTIRLDYTVPNFRKEEFLESVDSLSDTLAFYYPFKTQPQWKAHLMKEINHPDKQAMCYPLLYNISFAESEAVKNFPYFRRTTNRYRSGLRIDDERRRTYPYGDMARRSIGRVGQQGSRAVHGFSGLEKALDSLLFGKIGFYKKVPFTRDVKNWPEVPAINGNTLKTTIDVNMQDIAENELNKMLVEAEAEWGTLVLMEVATGDIKAMANLELNKKTGKYVEAMNRAVIGYEPGSVMKTISMVIALEDGFVRDPYNEAYNIESAYVFGGGNPIKDSHSDSPMPVSRFLEYSSNIGMTKLVATRFRNDINGFRERIRKLGLLERFGTGIADETPPKFPTLDPERGGLVSLGRQTFGYASMIPPLYTCAFYNAVANDGKFVRPRLITNVINERGDSTIDVTYVNDNMCSKRTAEIVRDMLLKVVYGPKGTATKLRDDKVKIAGKTGTSRIAKEMSPEDYEKYLKNPKDPTIVKPKGYYDGQYRFSFCGFFPYETPKYTCMVMISRPNGAHRTAEKCSGRVVLNVARRMYSRGMLGDKIKPDATASTDKSPVLYATHNAERDGKLAPFIGTNRARRIKTPESHRPGKVPGVVGLGLREAVVVLEKSGYNVKFTGDGTVQTQSPAPGTTARTGSNVTLQLARK